MTRIASLPFGRLIEKTTVVDVDAQNNTFSAAQIRAGAVVHTSTTGGGTVTTATAAQIISGVPLKFDGATIAVLYVNDGNQTLTFQGGDNVTISDTGQTIAENESALVVFRRTSSSAVRVFIVGA